VPKRKKKERISQTYNLQNDVFITSVLYRKAFKKICPFFQTQPSRDRREMFADGFGYPVFLANVFGSGQKLKSIVTSVRGYWMLSRF